MWSETMAHLQHVDQEPDDIVAAHKPNVVQQWSNVLLTTAERVCVCMVVCVCMCDRGGGEDVRT